MKLLFISVSLQVLIAVVFSLPVKEYSICPKYNNFFGYEPSHVGCCIDHIHCSVPVDLTSNPRILRDVKEMLGPSRIRARRHKRAIASAYEKEKKLSKYYYLCRSTVSVITPVYATSATTNTQVQLLQVPPVMTQSIVVHTCEERETPIVRGYCQQHFKRESVYVVIPSNSTYGDVSFQREYILVGSGCDIAVDDEHGYLHKPYQYASTQGHPYAEEHKSNYQAYNPSLLYQQRYGNSSYPAPQENAYDTPSSPEHSYGSVAPSIAVPINASNPYYETSYDNRSSIYPEPMNNGTPDSASYPQPYAQSSPTPPKKTGDQPFYPRPEDLMYHPGVQEPRYYGPPGEYSRGSGGKPGPGPQSYNGRRLRGRDDEIYIRDPRYSDPGRATGHSGEVAHGSSPSELYEQPYSIGMPLYSVSGNKERIRSLMTGS
ncbi:unnamed protein product [Allacma fusca]|uniref:Uncharacterized protein n=1 Tax=Allacma fusca TaxID=39272 RepID=A0A8J2PNB0_9HEXA|nr:unnamed protein product [Allacma fusca]